MTEKRRVRLYISFTICYFYSIVGIDCQARRTSSLARGTQFMKYSITFRSGNELKSLLPDPMFRKIMVKLALKLDTNTFFYKD